MIDLSNDRFGASLLKIGIGSFILSLILMCFFTYFSIPAKEAEKRIKSLIKLDRKEIRRSIAISFTILYILMISFYFHEVESATNVTSAVNYFVNETVINVTANSSFTTTTILNKTTNLTGNALTGEGLTHLKGVIDAFTTVYIIIIGFYFGSRVYEKIKEIKNAEDALKIQYIMDEIDSAEFNKKTKELRGRINSQLRINATESPKEITIEHRGGDDIDLKDTKIVIKMNEKQIKIDPVACASNMFKVTHKMVIYMEKTTTQDAITVTDIIVNNKSTGVKKEYISNGITEWKKGKKVEVDVVYKPTKEIISPWEGKIK